MQPVFSDLNFWLTILQNSFIIYGLLIAGSDVTDVYSLQAVGRMFQGTDDTYLTCHYMSFIFNFTIFSCDFNSECRALISCFVRHNLKRTIRMSVIVM
jgi:hypothetical protein